MGDEKKDDEGAGADSSEEKRVHPSDKGKQAYSYAEFLQFSNGDEKKAKQMWGESKPAGSNDKKWEQKKDDKWAEKKDEKWAEKKDSGEEKRVHPSDKGKTAYSYAEFLQFSNGDDKKAQRMWNEAKPAD